MLIKPRNTLFRFEVNDERVGRRRCLNHISIFEESRWGVQYAPPPPSPAPHHQPPITSPPPPVNATGFTWTSVDWGSVWACQSRQCRHFLSPDMTICSIAHAHELTYSLPPSPGTWHLGSCRLSTPLLEECVGRVVRWEIGGSAKGWEDTEGRSPLYLEIKVTSCFLLLAAKS